VLLGTVLVSAMVLAACGDESGSGSGSDTGAPLVVVTTPILGDVVASALGDAADVRVVMPRGADPHAFEASARQIAEMGDASLVVANGLGLESQLQEALEAAEGDGVPVLEVAPELDPIDFDVEHDHEEHEDDASHEGDEEHEDDEAGDEHDHGELDPHVWFDPSRMADAVPLIVDAFLDAAPDANPDEVRATADAFADELRALDAEVEEVLADIPADQRILVTNHDNLGYLADRYGFEVLGVVVPGGDTLAAPSAGALDELVEEIEHHDAPAVVTDEGVASDLADALAQEADTEVAVVALYTDTLGDEGGESGTYVEMMRTNAERIAEALR
jgi:zinc/manganese transport system substrate-binding protein